MSKIEENSTINKILRGLLTVLILIGSFFVLNKLPRDQIQAYIENAGNWAVLIYILLFTILPVFLLPVPILVFAAAIAFDFWPAMLYTTIGVMTNSTLIYIVARFIAGDWVYEQLDKRLSKKMMERFFSPDSRIQFIVMLVARFLPIIPYNMVGYVSGLTKMNFKAYLITTFIGVIPGTFVYLNIGRHTENLMSKDFVLSLVFMVLLLVFSLSFYFYMDKKMEEIEEREQN